MISFPRRNTNKHICSDDKNIERKMPALSFVLKRTFSSVLLIALILSSVLFTSSCGQANVTSGPAYTYPNYFISSDFNENSAVSIGGAAFDLSYANSGYIAVKAESIAKLKLQVSKDSQIYNYDLPSDGTPISVPVNMGNGNYTLRVMQKVSDDASNYVQLAEKVVSIELVNEFMPFLRPNVFCDYTQTSSAVVLAKSIAVDCQNQGEVIEKIYDWVVKNVVYDNKKASELSDASGYIPKVQSTYEELSGICFDYASLFAAMVRSCGIPCQIITGYVSGAGTNDIYHAWNMVYIDGEWKNADITVNPDIWTRIDTTFASSKMELPAGVTYTARYIY